MHGELVVVSAVGLLANATSPGDHELLRAQLEHEWTASARRPGLAIRTVLRDGNPVSVLLAVADEVDADVIVVGSRGFGGFPELLLGSTSTQLAQHTHRAVLIVPRPDVTVTTPPGDRYVLLSDGRSAHIRPLHDDDADAGAGAVPNARPSGRATCASSRRCRSTPRSA